MDKTKAMQVIGQAMEAASAVGDQELRGQLATLYYKVTATDW